jgi:hypothetical protein
MKPALVITAACLAVWGSHPRSEELPSVVHVGPNVQVSAAKASTMHGEGMIVADPTDGRRLLVCSMSNDQEIGQGIVAYASHDRGVHWQRTFPTPNDKPGGGDPACAFGPDGVAYLTMIPGDSTAEQLRMPVFRSEDGGQTWHAVGVTGFLDRESIVVDGTGGRFHNRVYVHGVASPGATDGARLSVVRLYTSVDGGRTFGRPAERVSPEPRAVFPAGNGIVLSDGRWVAVFGELKHSGDRSRLATAAEPENSWVKIVTSDDGGDSLNAPVTVSGWHMPNNFLRQSSLVPTIAADSTHGPFCDRLYVVWPDSRFGGTDVLFAYSTDRGNTWSQPTMINDDRAPSPSAAAPNHLLPAVAVNSAGVVAITWLDRRDAPDNLGWRERVRVSLDGGETFLTSTVVAEASARFDGREHWPTSAITGGSGAPSGAGSPARLTILASPHIYFPGDYATVTADRDGVFHAYWIDNRTGWHQVWTASIDVAGSGIKNGSIDLADLDDLTRLITLKAMPTAYDRGAETASVTLRLINSSPKTLRGPFKLRLLRADSDVAALESVGASNGLTGPGAVWDVSSSTDGSRLDPGATSGPFVLTFKLHDVRPLLDRLEGKNAFRLVTSFIRVLGHIEK